MCCLKVVQELRFLDSGDRIECLQFDYHLIVADKIGTVGAVELLALVIDRQLHLAGEWNGSGRHFDRKRVLINGLQESCTELSMNLHGRTDNCVSLFVSCICTHPGKTQIPFLTG